MGRRYNVSPTKKGFFIRIGETRSCPVYTLQKYLTHQPCFLSWRYRGEERFMHFMYCRLFVKRSYALGVHVQIPAKTDFVYQRKVAEQFCCVGFKTLFNFFQCILALGNVRDTQNSRRVHEPWVSAHKSGSSAHNGFTPCCPRY